MNNNVAYWSEFVNILGIQHHELLYVIDEYNDGNMFGSVATYILGTVKVCASLIVLIYLLFIVKLMHSLPSCSADISRVISSHLSISESCNSADISCEFWENRFF